MFLSQFHYRQFNSDSVLIGSGWFNVLSRVHSATAQQLREMQDEQANPKNAVVSYCATSLWACLEPSVFNYLCMFLQHMQCCTS